MTEKTAGTPAQGFAYGCAVAPEDAGGSKLYVGGSILDGAYMNDASDQRNIGGEDAWVAQLDAQDGTVQCMCQFATVDDDTLSRT